ncbi:MAG: D-sedoheptulose-7-phosphate isomerase, partial [Acidimicrobiales bacterium]
TAPDTGPMALKIEELTMGEATTLGGPAETSASVARNHIEAHLGWVKECIEAFDLDAVESIVDLIVDACNNRRQVFIFGNGGSASTASHFCCDLGKGQVVEGKPRLRVASLNDNMAWITAIANDISYDEIFKEQLVNFLEPEDVVIAISASGNSPSIISAMEYVNEVGAVGVGMIGFGGGKLANLCKESLIVDSYDYGVVEGLHLVLEHMIAQSVGKKLISEL